MKKNVIKTAVAVVCVVAAGMGGLRAYNVANQSQAEMLLAENIDALSQGDYGDDGDYGDEVPVTCYIEGKNDTRACTLTEAVVGPNGRFTTETYPGTECVCNTSKTKAKECDYNLTYPCIKNFSAPRI